MTQPPPWQLWSHNRWLPLSEHGAALWLSGHATRFDPDERLVYTANGFTHEWTAADVEAMGARVPASAFSDEMDVHL